MGEIMEKFISVIGTLLLIGIAVLLSSNRKKISWKLVFYGTSLQIIFAILILKWEPGKIFFRFMNDVIIKILDFTAEGSKFLFGSLITDIPNLGYIFAFQVLPTIIFFSSFMTVLYYLGIMQGIVKFFAIIMAKTMGTSGAESLSASANIFVGQTEAPLVIKPYINKMTISELMAVMTGGMATVAGGVMAGYVGMLKDVFPDIAGHLLAASIMSAPAALVMAKIMIPETQTPETAGDIKMNLEIPDVNVIDAAARGAGEGMQLAINVAAMLLAFIALIAMINHVLISVGDGFNWLVGKQPTIILAENNFNNQQAKLLVGKTITINLEKGQYGALKQQIFQAQITGINGNKIIMNSKLYAPSQKGLSYSIIDQDGKIMSVGKAKFGGALKLSMEIIFGFFLAPVAWIMGVPWKDAHIIGSLLGEKTVINEFVAYSHLGQLLHHASIHLAERSKVIVAYALCGFANFSSIAIQIGGIGGIAPNRRHDLAKLGIKSMIAGTLAAFMTATIAGILI